MKITFEESDIARLIQKELQTTEFIYAEFVDILCEVSGSMYKPITIEVKQ